MMKSEERFWVLAGVLIGLILLNLVIADLWKQNKTLRADQNALRATVAALREGDGSCAVMDNGVRSVCWYEGGAVRVLPLRPGDVIVGRDCLVKRRRAECAR